MHPLQRNHRSWILTALFVAVTQVHQGECDDGLVKSIVQNGKTGFLKTYEKTYHTKYEFDLNNAVHQTGRLLRKLARPVVTVETDPALINEEQLQETAFDLEAYCESDEDELIRGLHNEESHRRPEVLHGNSAEEGQRVGEEDRLHAKKGIFNIGKLFFKPTIFKKKLQKIVHDPDAFNRDAHHSEDPFQIHDTDAIHRDGHHSEDPFQIHDTDAIHSDGHHSEDPLQIHDTNAIHRDGHHSEDPLQIHDPDTFHRDGPHSEDHLNTTKIVSSAREDPTAEHEEQILHFGKLLFNPKFFRKALQKIMNDRDTSHRDAPHSEDPLQTHDPDPFHRDGHQSEDPLQIHDPDTFDRDGHRSEDPLQTHDPDIFHRDGQQSEDPLQTHDPDIFQRDGPHSADHLNKTEDVSSAREAEEKDRAAQQEEQIINFGKQFFNPTFFKKALQKIMNDRDTSLRDAPHSEDPLKILDPDIFHTDGHHSEDYFRIHDPDLLQTHEHHSEDHLNTTENVSSTKQDQPLTRNEPVTDTLPIHDLHPEELLHTTDENEGHLDATEVPGMHSAEDGQLHPKEVVIPVVRPVSILNLFNKNLGRTFHRPDTVHSHDHHSGEQLGATEPAEVASAEEDPTTEEEDPPPTNEEDPIVGKPLPKSRLIKRLHKPVLVSVLKNFKLMFHIPIKLSKYEAKPSLELPAKTQTQTQTRSEDYCDGDLIT